MKRELNKWQWGFVIAKRPPWIHPVHGFFPYIRFYCLKFTSFVDAGATFGKENYTGFYWDWMFRKTFIVRTRTIILPLRLRKALWMVGIRTSAVYAIPTWLSFGPGI